MKNQIELICFSWRMNWPKYDTIVCWILYFVFADQDPNTWCTPQRISIFNQPSWCNLNISLCCRLCCRPKNYEELLQNAANNKKMLTWKSNIFALEFEGSGNPHFICFMNGAHRIELYSLWSAPNFWRLLLISRAALPTVGRLHASAVTDRSAEFLSRNKAKIPVKSFLLFIVAFWYEFREYLWKKNHNKKLQLNI